MITGIAHAAYHVTDMAKSIGFYCGQLGLKEAFCFRNDQGEIRLQYLSIPGTAQFVELFPAKEGTAPTAGTYYGHLCLQVDNAEETQAEFTARGVEIVTPLKLGGDGNWQFWAQDPDGNRIEFMQITSASEQMKALRR